MIGTIETKMIIKIGEKLSYLLYQNAYFNAHYF
jgi:hypothetical protein